MWATTTNLVVASFYNIIRFNMDIFKELNVTKEEGFLANGVKVVLFKKEGAPILTSAVLRSGSKYDPEGMNGVAHFIEHMIVNGSKKFPSKDLLAEHIESVGGSFGAATSLELMFINTEISDKEDYSRVVDIFRATLCEPLMDKNVFENEKNIVIKEIHRSHSDPKKVRAKAIRELFFKNTRIEHGVLGEENDIKNLEYSKTIEVHKKLFDKSRITFVACGDIELEEIINNLNKLDLLSENDFKEIQDGVKNTENIKTLATFFDIPQTHIFIGGYSAKSFSRDAYCLSIVGGILAGGRNSRLTKKLRYEKGLIYSIASGRIGVLDFGTFGLFTDTTVDKVQEVIDLIIEELKIIERDGFKKEEVDFVKNRTLKSFRISMQTSNDWVSHHDVSSAFNIDFDVNKFFEIISSITPDEVNESFKKYLSPEKIKLVLCGKTKTEDMVFNP